MIKVLSSAILALVIVLPLLPARAGMPYVLYLSTWGAWTVTCSEDMASKAKSCTLSTPPPALGTMPDRITVTQITPDSFAVQAKTLGSIDPAYPLSLVVDGHLPLKAKPTPFGEVTWRGRDAQVLVSRMEQGRNLRLHSVGADGRAKEEILHLDGFPQALQALRQKVREYKTASE